MKKVILAAGALLISVSAFASKGILDGKRYCTRHMYSEDSVAEPADTYRCLSFKAGVVTDYTDAGYKHLPPNKYSHYNGHFNYKVNGENVSFGTSEYVIGGDGDYLTSGREILGLQD
ncbi:MAG: hypothetical protein V4654_04500 [Bdellovibrionota bacterium]